MHAIRHGLIVCAGVFAILALGVAPVSAGKPNTVHFVDHGDQAVHEFTECGAGLPLTVYTTGVVSGTITFDADGNFLSIVATAATNDVITNTENGLVATAEYAVRFRNSPDIDLGDGTIALYQTTTGTGKLRGPDGTILWHGAGLTDTYLILIPVEDMGPTIVSQEILAQHGLRPDSTFCEALLPALGL